MATENFIIVHYLYTAAQVLLVVHMSVSVSNDPHPVAEHSMHSDTV